MNPCQFFKCLADETRLLSVLLIREVGEACVCDLVAALDQDQPKISRHLASLRKCGILHDERRGKWVYYQLSPQLPVWAKEVIHRTAADNPGYFADALARVKSSLASRNCC
ncbi:metalloregulator ArsR/SmtB family transcription factor [Alteromonas sp. ASW11-19]|uniref:Metalloregulator ArsR/SmtB family transcription factor n=2 Tax=Alteromonas salexigens TaxID=2982530 RepID=A0ABT2VQ47_9ALTE|nr:metalloregulator ArsR/SmtB family transcription factor [Alteromonas salexigens]MCU7555439.1 metalloregulator ArsR/SmtB family transcription factor [Alteromonas salexigens]